jgi:hypothetical protein
MVPLLGTPIFIMYIRTLSVIFWVLSTKVRQPGLSLNDGWIYFGAMMRLVTTELAPWSVREFCDKHGAESER